MTVLLAIMMVVALGTWIPLTQLWPATPERTRIFYVAVGNVVLAGRRAPRERRRPAARLAHVLAAAARRRGVGGRQLLRPAGVAADRAGPGGRHLDAAQHRRGVRLGRAALRRARRLLRAEPGRAGRGLPGRGGRGAADRRCARRAGRAGGTARGDGQPVPAASKRAGFLWAGAAGVLWGSYFIPAQWADVPAQVSNVPLALGILVGALVLCLPAREPVRLALRPTLGLLGAGLLFGLGNLALLGLVSRVGTGTGFTIAQLSLAVNAGIGIWFFHVPRPGTSQARRVLTGILIAGIGERGHRGAALTTGGRVSGGREARSRRRSAAGPHRGGSAAGHGARRRGGRAPGRRRGRPRRRGVRCPGRRPRPGGSAPPARHRPRPRRGRRWRSTAPAAAPRADPDAASAASSAVRVPDVGSRWTRRVAASSAASTPRRRAQGWPGATTTTSRSLGDDPALQLRRDLRSLDEPELGRARPAPSAATSAEFIAARLTAVSGRSAASRTSHPGSRCSATVMLAATRSCWSRPARSEAIPASSTSAAPRTSRAQPATSTPAGVRDDPRAVRSTSGTPTSPSIVRTRAETAGWLMPCAAAARPRRPVVGDLEEQGEAVQVGDARRHHPGTLCPPIEAR